MSLNRFNYIFYAPLPPEVRKFRRAQRAGPSRGPLSLYPLATSGRFIAMSTLVALPSGRFGPLCCHFGHCPSTLLPFRQLFADGGPCPSTFWPKKCAIGPWRPLSLYPLADFSPRPTWGPLLIYALAEKMCDRPFSLHPLTDFSPRPNWGPLFIYPGPPCLRTLPTPLSA